MCSAVLIDWDPATSPPSPRIWAHIRGPYWPAKIDNISLWPPAYCTAVGNGAMNKFVICLAQWTLEAKNQNEATALWMLCSIDNGATNARCVGNCAMMPVAMLRPVRIHHVFPIHTRSLSSLWALKFQQWVTPSWVAQCSWGGVVVHPSLYLLSCSHNSAIIYHYWKQEGVG
jgi:hypothetical protein